MATGQAPALQRMEATIPATAAAVDYDQAIGEVEMAGTVTSVAYIPEANITGANTETRTLTLVNKGADGNGTTVVATRALTSGVNSTDFNEDELTLSVVALATTVAVGDVLAFVSTHSGSTGLADPGGRLVVEVSRTV